MKILVGGAAVDEKFVEEIWADTGVVPQKIVQLLVARSLHPQGWRGIAT